MLVVGSWLTCPMRNFFGLAWTKQVAKIQVEIKEEYEKQKQVVRKRLNEQFPNRSVDEGETAEQQPEPDKPTCDPAKSKPDLDKVFNHVQQLLMNDELLEDVSILFGKHKDRIIIETPVNSAKENVVIIHIILRIISRLLLQPLHQT